MAFEVKEMSPSKIGLKMFKSMSLIPGVEIPIPKGTLRKEDELHLFRDTVLSKFGSIENLKHLATSGQDCKAQYFLSTAYQEGIPEFNIEKDIDKAMDLLESARKNGDHSASSTFELAILHEKKGKVADQRRAHELYIEAAKLGFIPAELNLAERYKWGVEGVVEMDLEEAFKWYRRAADEEPQEFDVERALNPSYHIKGNLRSIYIDFKFRALKHLHEYYMCGDCPEGKPQPVKALYYLKKAAELGDPEAQKDLGLSYLTGESGHPKDLEKAKRWLGKAANSGDQEAKEILKKFDAENIVENQAETSQSNQESLKQYLDILEMERRQNKHPFLMQHPMMFQESTFTQFPDSPTAQHYLKAFRLVKKGLEIIVESKFSDPKGITMLAHGYLYENTIKQSFPILRKPEFISSLLTWNDELLEKNPNFLEGLLLMFLLHPHSRHHNFESCKVDLRNTMFLSNLIHLIKKAEPDKPPKEDPYNFKEDYSSWLHGLYYLLGSSYIIQECYKHGAEAFDMALQCCPGYYEAKLPLGHCLMYLKLSKHQREDVTTPTEKLLEIFAIPKNQRIYKGDYLSWTEDQLRQKAKQLFIEYLKEAPECDKKYQDGNYHLAYLYMLEGNLQEAAKWKERGEDSEEKRLPFMEPLNLASKKLLEMRNISSQQQRMKRKGRS